MPCERFALHAMILDDVLTFLKKVPPFQFLEEGELRAVAANASIDFYPKDTVILRQDGPPSEALRIIRRGGVKVWMRTETGDELTIDYRGEGDTFGFLSLVGKDRVRANVTAVEDTECYLVGREMMQKLIDRHLSFTEYFLTTHLAKYIDRTYREMQDKTLVYGGSDRLLFTTRIGDIASREVVTAPLETPIREAAQIMARQRVSSIVLTDRDGLPAGIVTDRDLRAKVVATAMNMDAPARMIMSSPLITVDARDYCYEAVLKMVQFNIHHVLVVRDGRLSGIITNHDLVMLQGTSPLSLTKDIEYQHTVDGLASVSKRINGVVGLLLKEGARAGNITQVIAEINDRLVRRVLELTEKKHGKPPVPYCWIVYGSEGRKEQTFKTDQDNAIIYQDPRDAAEAEEVARYFAPFAETVSDALIAIGFPPCPGGYMASNPRWRMPLSSWKEHFATWIRNPTSEALLAYSIIFDFRPVYGSFDLAERLRSFIFDMLAEKPNAFFANLAASVIQHRPPLGFFKTFLVEKTGSHKEMFDIKVRGIAPLVDIIRFWALEKGTVETATLERIEHLRQKPGILQDYADDLVHAFEFMMLLRLHYQMEQINKGLPPDNFINPKTLSTLERTMLKDVFGLISRLQDKIYDYQYWQGSLR